MQAAGKVGWQADRFWEIKDQIYGGISWTVSRPPHQRFQYSSSLHFMIVTTYDLLLGGYAGMAQ